MSRNLRFSLLLLVVLLLAACDTTGRGGYNPCPGMPDASTKAITGSVCDYNAKKHGTEIYAYAAPGMQGLSHYRDDPAPIVIKGEMKPSGAFHIDLPEALAGVTTDYATICETGTGAPLTSGPIVKQLLTLQEGEALPANELGFSAWGETIGLRTLHEYQDQFWIYSPAADTVKGHCPAVGKEPALDANLNLSKGWNLAVLTKTYAPGADGEEAVVLKATFENGTSTNTAWMFTPIWRMPTTATN